MGRESRIERIEPFRVSKKLTKKERKRGGRGSREGKGLNVNMFVHEYEYMPNNSTEICNTKLKNEIKNVH
jgi:hypothetical protein